MKKKLLMIAIVVAVLASLMAMPVLAKGKHGQSGKSNVEHLYLYEKDSSWDIVPDGAWGKMKYNLAGPTFDYVFNGHGLQANTNYHLIYYADPWPGSNPGALIASGTSDGLGDIHLGGSVDLGMDLPTAPDTNVPAGGAKIWLVTDDCVDITAGTWTAWTPTDYLFEHNLITFDDTDV